MKTALSGVGVAVLLVGAIVLGYHELSDSALVADSTVAPGFVFERVAGGTLSSGELRGQVVVLDFWATWCPPCVEELPWLVKVAHEYEPRGVRFVAANQDDVDEQKVAVNLFVTDRVPELRPHAVYGDPETAAKFKVGALPTLYVIGRDGRVVGATAGMTSERAVRSWLDAALSRAH